MDAWQLYFALFFSTVGFSYLIYGKKRPAPAFMIAGVALLIFGYFVYSVPLILLVGGALCAAPFFWRG